MLFLWVQLGKLCKRDHRGEGRELLWPDPAPPVLSPVQAGTSCGITTPGPLCSLPQHPQPAAGWAPQGWPRGSREETPTGKNEKKKKKGRIGWQPSFEGMLSCGLGGSTWVWFNSSSSEAKHSNSPSQMEWGETCCSHDGTSKPDSLQCRPFL